VARCPCRFVVGPQAVGLQVMQTWEVNQWKWQVLVLDYDHIGIYYMILYVYMVLQDDFGFMTIFT
jgi:hypothetical protein